MVAQAPKRSRTKARNGARLAAVQALYQMDLAKTDLNAVVVEFAEHRFREASDEVGHAEVEVGFFHDLLKGVVDRQREIDPLIDKQLAAGWRLARLDSILRAILRSATYELLARPDVPAKAVIGAYVDIAHDFFAGDEPKVVNGVTDKLAHKLRAGELGPTDKAASE
ncbi:MAG: transcription antitermination factor NusB [Hyphomicrobiaceae bacterium]